MKRKTKTYTTKNEKVD